MKVLEITPAAHKYHKEFLEKYKKKLRNRRKTFGEILEELQRDFLEEFQQEFLEGFNKKNPKISC